MDRRALLLLLLMACDGPLDGGQGGGGISGDTDGGGSSGDGGGTAGDGGTAGPLEGVAQLSREGQLTLATGSLSGAEIFAAVGAHGEVDCAVSYALTSTSSLDSCDTCEWAFRVQASGAAVTSALGCDTVDLQATGFDGQVYDYGYDMGYGEGAGALMYGYAGTWYSVGGVTVDDSTGDGDAYRYDWTNQALWTY